VISYWVQSSEPPALPQPVHIAEHAEVVVIGGGIVGLTAATELSDAGFSVMVIEADALGRGVTAQSTAKVTVATGLRIDQIGHRHGVAAAREYLTAGLAGMSWIAAKADAEAMASTDHLLYATTDGGRQRLQAHARFVRSLGLDVRTTESLIFQNTFEITYPEQLLLQPVDYLHHLARRLVRAGQTVVTKHPVLSVQGRGPYRVNTDTFTVSGDHVVVATHAPIGRAPWLLPITQRRHQAAVVETSEPTPCAFGVDDGWSVRPIPGHDGLAVVVGGEQEVGSDESEARADMDTWVHDSLGGKIVDRWSSQDVFSGDLLPFVGSLGVRRGVITATGFGSWGLAHGTAAGIDVAQRVMGGRPRWDSWNWDPTSRRALGMAGPLVSNGVQSAKSMVKSRVAPVRAVAKRRSVPDTLEPGDGTVLQSAGGAVAVSVGHDGVRRELSATCTHLGCLVAWNRAEQSWDCGCHGSRFAPTGDVLHGPAVAPLSPVSSAQDNEEAVR
jgi:glycine/D-amino acid oxidase-like deaminating enzyme/nitrite reductase/ring-hydroxylating ferredoxin subunit